MNTFVLNPNDTIVLNDNVVVKIMKTSDTWQTCVNEAATNWADVEIVKYICLAAVLVALIVVIAIYLCYQKRINAEQMQKDLVDEQKRTKELDQLLKKEKEKNREFKEESNNNANKTKSDRSIEILKEIVSLARNKDCKADADTANKVHELYKKIKSDLKPNNNEG